MSRLFEPRLLIRTLVSLGLLVFLVWRVDLRAAWDALGEANYVYVAPALVLFGASKLLVAQRWRLMMTTFSQLPLAPLFGIFMVSCMANNVVPARIGDLIRVQVPAQRYDMSRARLAATVFATESLLDGIAFAVLGLIGLALIDIDGFPTEVFWGLLGLITGAVLAVIPLSHLKFSQGWTERSAASRLPEMPRRLLDDAVPHFIDGLAVFRDVRLGTQAMVLSFAIWLLEIGMFALFGLAFGIHLSMPAWILIMIAANMISAVPVAPSNIGAYEVAITELTKALGVAAGPAGAFAIAVHIFNITAITVVGVVSLYALKLTWSDVFSLGNPPTKIVPADEGRPPTRARAPSQ